MEQVGKMLVFAGIGIVLIGLLLWAGFGKGWFGQLPGDIAFEKGNARFYFPIATCILLSLALTLLFWFLKK